MCGGTLKEGLVAIAEHHQPRSRARTNRALRSLARALRDAAPRTRALLRSPARAGPGSRARALEASLVRLLHSLRAEWAVGSSCSAGWEGEEGRGRRRSAWGEGPRRASGEGAEKRGQAPRPGRPGRQSGWAPCLVPAHLLRQLLSARPFRSSSCSLPGIPGRELIQRFCVFFFHPLGVVPLPEPRTPDSGKNDPCCSLPRFLSQTHCEAFV